MIVQLVFQHKQKSRGKFKVKQMIINKIAARFEFFNCSILKLVK